MAPKFPPDVPPVEDEDDEDDGRGGLCFALILIGTFIAGFIIGAIVL